MENENNANQNTENGNGNGFLISFLSISIVVLLSYIGYIYYTKDVMKKGELSKNYVKTDDMAFSMLPSYIQDDYVSKETYTDKVNELQRRIQQINSIKNVQNSKSAPMIIEKIIELRDTVEKKVNVEVEVEKVVEVEKIIEKVVEVEKIIEKVVEVEKIIEKIVEIEKVVEVEKVVEIEVPTPIIIDKKNFRTYTCKDLNSGTEYISKKCTTELISFLNKNKNSKLYEIIGMVDSSEFRLVKTLEDVYGKDKIGNLSKYAQVGLSRKRVVETAWIVKTTLPKGSNIKNVNYTITSKNKRGFVVRAYE